MKDMTFFRFIPVIHAENPKHTLRFSGRLYPRQVHTCVTSDSHVFEVDLHMHNSFLNAALSIHHSVIIVSVFFSFLSLIFNLYF